MNQFISHFVHDQLVCIMTVFGVQTIIDRYMLNTKEVKQIVTLRTDLV